ncbi:MAG TPA: hypothetical protein VEZ24_08750 [Microvirga sp.]|nr:hypothetical protein [Microvirga sp.]
MRHTMIFPLSGFAALFLAGCSTSPAPQGVLPRENLPPPPSITGSTPNRTSAAVRTDAQGQTQRRSLSVPDRLVPPRPAVQP